MTKEERDKLINKYARSVVDGMDDKALCIFATEQIEENMQHFNDEDLITEIENYDSDLLT